MPIISDQNPLIILYTDDEVKADQVFLTVLYTEDGGPLVMLPPDPAVDTPVTTTPEPTVEDTTPPRTDPVYPTSCPPFRLFKKDTEVRIKAHGSAGEYAVVRPFGGKHYEDGAEI